MKKEEEKTVSFENVFKGGTSKVDPGQDEGSDEKKTELTLHLIGIESSN